MQPLRTLGGFSIRAAAGACAAALGVAMFCTGPALAQTVNLRMHTFVPPVSGSFKSLTWWVEKVEKDSGGKLKITLYGSMQLGGKPGDLYDQVRTGAVDIAWTLPGYTAGLFPVMSAFELPFIGDTAPVASAALDEFVRKWGKAEWSEVHPIVFHSAGPGVIHMKEHMLQSLADFKGQKIRTPSRLSTLALSALGATPVPIPSLKVTEALMHNVVDGAVLPWSIALAIRTIDVSKYHVETTLHEPTLAMLMNKQSYAKLPPDLKKVIDANSGEWLAKEFGRRWAADDLRGVDKAKKLGHQIIVISPEEEVRWRKASQPVYDAWIKEMDAKGFSGRQLVEEADRLIAKYKAENKAK
jgi:TRAP-type C4-dicarboxylate transport system substrate-binding protein